MIDACLHKTLGKNGFTIQAVLTAAPGSFYALSGGSGAGKTTFLRMISGLIRPDSGHLTVSGEVWYDSSSGYFLPPQKRRTGFVFQQTALFPHMSVRQNIDYASPDKIRTEWLLKLCGISEFRDRYPTSLSGGQKQRVAVARALSHNPGLLLLDEPFSALDPKLRGEMQDMIAGVQRETGITAVMVTHDSREIFRLASTVFQMENGKIIKSGSPASVLLNQKSSGKFSFYGEVIQIIPSDSLFIAIVAVGSQIVETVLTADEAETIKPGDAVMLSAKAFQTLIQKGGHIDS